VTLLEVARSNRSAPTATDPAAKKFKMACGSLEGHERKAERILEIRSSDVLLTSDDVSACLLFKPWMVCESQARLHQSYPRFCFVSLSGRRLKHPDVDDE
jgi:hypothetical protein